MEVGSCEPNSRGCVFSDWLGKNPDLFGQRAKRVEMETDVRSLVTCCYNPYILRRDEALDPFDGLAQEGIFSHDPEHLLRDGLAAQGPESGA